VELPKDRLRRIHAVARRQINGQLRRGFTAE
jgi:hypothetical protein